MALVRSSKSSKSSNNLNIKPQDKVDIHGVQRAACTNCSECPQFISVTGHVLCAYCGCPPVKHKKVGCIDIDNIAGLASSDLSSG